MEQEPVGTAEEMDEGQPRAVQSAAEPARKPHADQDPLAPPGPPHPAPTPFPTPPEESVGTSLAVEAPLDLALPGPAVVELVAEPVGLEVREAPAPPEPAPAPMFALEAERLTPPLVSSDTPLLAAPEVEVLDNSAPAVAEIASSPAITPEPESAMLEREVPVLELEVASGATIATIPAPVLEDAAHLAGDPFSAPYLVTPASQGFGTTAVAAAEPEPEPVYESGPNWMLAFVTAWAGGTALFEAWELTAPNFRLAVMLSAAFLGYATLGLGMLGFAVESLRPTRGRLGARLGLLAPALLTLLGIALLLLSHTPGRRI